MVLALKFGNYQRPLHTLTPTPHQLPPLPKDQTPPTCGKCYRPAPQKSQDDPTPFRGPEPDARSSQVPSSSFPSQHPKPSSSLFQIAAKEAEGAGGGNGWGRLLTQLRRLPSPGLLIVSEAVAGHCCDAGRDRIGPARGSLRPAPARKTRNKTSSRRGARRRFRTRHGFLSRPGGPPPAHAQCASWPEPTAGHSRAGLDLRSPGFWGSWEAWT